MEGSSEEETVLQKKKAAAQRRLEEHIAWKRSFFQARPPPPPIGQLHRRQEGKKKGHACHAAFQCAVALHQAMQEQEAHATSAPHSEEANISREKAGAASCEVPPLTSSAPGGTAAVSSTTSPTPLTKQEAWAAQLHGEAARRNPATDLNVRSDPTRTVLMANLHPDTVEEDVRHFADQFGRVVHVRIVRHHKTGKSRRYAFVEFGLAGEARRALQFHRKKRLKGHAIIIDREKGRTEVGFLPKRMATAEAFLSAQGGGRGDRVASGGEQAVRGGASVQNGEKQPSSIDAAGAATTTDAPSIPVDDDDFLNSILNS